jgi:hypothetical protein
MGATVADYNGDGRPDIFKTNFSEDTPTLYRNEGHGTFADVTNVAGLGKHTQYLGWGTMFFDFDNDGWPDLILVNGHVYPELDKFPLGLSYKERRLLYHNNGNGTFTWSVDWLRVLGRKPASPTRSPPLPSRCVLPPGSSDTACAG